MTLIFIIAVLGLSACVPGADRDPGRTTDTQSSSFDNHADRVEFLKRYAIVPSPVIETQFHIVYWDNSTGRVPGPSDWTINYAVRIDAADLALWTEEFAPIDRPTAWDESMIEGWAITDDAPAFYQRATMTRAVYEADGVVISFSATT